MADTKKKKPSKLQKFLGACILLVLFAELLVFCSDNDPSAQKDQSTAKSQSVQQMVDNIKFLDMPDNRKATTKKAVAAFLRACPDIPAIASHGEKISAAYYPEGWERTPAHLDVELNLTRESMSDLPAGLQDPQWGGHIEVGLAGGRKPGAIMEMPLPLWLCGFHIDPNIVSGRVRDWEEQKHFLPIPSIPEHGF